MPETDVEMSRPSRSSSWVRSTACSSGVRLGTVERRQWWVRPRGAVGSCSVPMPTPTLSSGGGTWPSPSAAYSPITVSVLPTSMTSSTASLLRPCVSLRPGLGPDQVEPEIEHRGRVGQRADRDPVRSGGRVGPDGGQRHAAGHLGQDGPRRVEVRHGDGLDDRARVHVVEQHGVGAGAGGLGHLVERVALDLDHPPRPQRAGPADRVGDARAGQVVVLDQHGVGQPGAVVGAAAGPHRRLLEHAQARRRLAGVEHGHRRVAVVRRGDELRGQRGHARQVAEEVRARCARR